MGIDSHSNKLSKRRFWLVFVDILCIIISIYGALLIRFLGDKMPTKYLNDISLVLLPMIIIGLGIFYKFNLY